jgi:hypothetical protein
MKTLICCVAFTATFSSCLTGSAHADDAGISLLERILQPTRPQPMQDICYSGPEQRPEPEALAQLNVSSGTVTMKLVNLPEPRRLTRAPRLLFEPVPLEYFTADPAPPQRIEFPPTQLIRTPSGDVNQPLDLPVQATYKLDRASLDDPTADYSVQQAQGGELRQRDKKAAFVRVNLPEPFENRVEVHSALPEPPVVAPVPQPPK